uniref:Putative homing endonuclease n=1 Tax=viral metagenome TaxID=1070528 RepID=A0A6M3KX31_9ZZZZ
MKKIYFKNNKCINCGKEISRYSKFCHSCSQKGKRNHRFGKHSYNYKGEKYYCMDCGKLRSSKLSPRCKSCARKYQYKTRPETLPKGLSGKLNPNYKTGYSIKWKEARNKCFKRDKYICKLCDKKQNNYLNAHHIIHRNLCGNIFNVNNLITLCKDCHFFITKIEFSEKYLKYKNKFLNYTKKVEVKK